MFSNAKYFKSAIRISQANQKTCTNVSCITCKIEKNCFLRCQVEVPLRVVQLGNTENGAIRMVLK